MNKLSEFLQLPCTKEILDKPICEQLSREMNRDPFRPLYIDKEIMLSPADGFVLYHGIYKPDEDILNVKGGEYTVNTLLREEIKEPCLAIGIFMTVIDVHVNRVPTNGFVKYEKLPCLKVTNLSMRPVEKDILDNLKLDHDVMRYAFFNEAMKNEILVPYLKQCYYILQIADFEVDVIVPFNIQNTFYTQGERFSLVRFGSQVDLIIPFRNGTRYKCLIPDDGEIYHVKAGLDQLVRIN